MTEALASESLALRPHEPIPLTFSTNEREYPTMHRASFREAPCSISWHANGEGTNYDGVAVRGVGTHHEYLVTFTGLGKVWLLGGHETPLSHAPMTITDDPEPGRTSILVGLDVDVVQRWPRIHDDSGVTGRINPRTAIVLTGILAAIGREHPRF